MKKQLLIRDATLRDGQQSLFATRMTQKHVDMVIPHLKDSNFFALEVWGGAVPDSVMRYLNEDPWERLEKIREAAGSVKLAALSRGRNLFGYNPYPDYIIKGFIHHAIQSGISIMRIFDALNDTRNITDTVKYVKENQGTADCAMVYTVDPKFTFRQRASAVVHLKKLPRHIFDLDYFIHKAREYEAAGADILTIKDMAGLITPTVAGELVRKLKETVSIPIDLHTHCTPGYGLASALTAILNGVDIIDTSLLNFAGGPSNPPYELIQVFCDKLGIDTGINKLAASQANHILRQVREELAEFDSVGHFPVEFDINSYQFPKEVDKFFDLAIEYAGSNREEQLLDICHRILMYFDLPEPDDSIRKAEIPGGMYSNMLAQLKQNNLEHLLPKVLEMVPMVRLHSGCPPLVTPTSQIVGVQAVNCVLDENKGLPHFTSNSVQFVNLIKGAYGKTPVPVDPEFRKTITGSKKEVAFNDASYQRPENPICDKFGGVRVAQNEKEELLLDLFPSVASTFLRNRLETHYLKVKKEIEEEKQRKRDEIRARYESLSKEEKQKRLIEGLYNYQWTSDDEILAPKEDINFLFDEEEFPETGI